MTTYVENKPNASKLIEALRSAGYDNKAAIADLVDNSIDAEATKTYLNIIPLKEDFQIIAADNGIGMDKTVLDQAMRLGSSTERDQESDLGKFGMGLVTASISIGRRLTVITKKEGQYLTAIQDLDVIRKTNSFEKELRNSTKEETSEFDRHTHNAKSGTTVIIEKCDHLQDKNISEFCNVLEEELGRIFRLFIASKKSIFLRGNELKAIDPLMNEEKGTDIFSDETFDVEVGGQKEKVRVKIAFLPDYDTQTMKMKGLNITNQGFYLMRNNREIASGITLGIFGKHNDFNRMRIEVYFNGSLDSLMGINFTKREIKPKQNILDKIRAITNAQIKTIRVRVKKKQAAKNKEKIDHTPAAKIIFEKSKLLIKPDEKIEKRERPDHSKEGTIVPKNTGSVRVPKNSKQVLSERANCVFEPRFSPGANLFETEQVGKKTYIYYNLAHPFYESFIASNEDNQELINAFDFLIYSLATAKLKMTDDKNEAMLENIFSIFSVNLRTLMS